MADNFTIMLGPYEAATIEEATQQMRDKAVSEVFEEKLSKLAPIGKTVNKGFLDSECGKLLSGALINLKDGEGYEFDSLLKNVQTTLNTFSSNGLRKLKFKAKVQANQYLSFLQNTFNNQPGCNTDSISDLLFGDGVEVDTANVQTGTTEDLQPPLEDEDDLRPPTEQELKDYGTTDSGLDIFKAELNKAKEKIQQKLNEDDKLNQISQITGPTNAEGSVDKLPVPLIDPKDLDATHVVLKKSKKPPLLRSKAAVAANKSKPWKALVNGNLVKVIKQNVGRGGKFHEIEVKTGEFADSKGFIKTSELRPLIEGVLFDVKAIEQPTDVRSGGFASGIPDDWRKRQPGTPYLIVNQDNPEESSYEITIRTKFANFGTKSEKVFLTEYAALGVYEIFNYYNKDFKIPLNKDTEKATMTPAEMSVLLAGNGFTLPSEKGFPAEWHLDTTTASARILVYIRIPVKKLDQFPKRLETFEFDKVIEGEEQPMNTDGLIGSKKQVTAAQQMFIDAAYLPQASIPEYISINNHIPSNTLTCKFGHLMQNIETLKEVMAFYDAAMKQDSEGRIASFPFGPVRGPLDLLKEIERLEQWKVTFEEFLKGNDYDYNGEPCADSSLTSSPKSPQEEDVIEFGWNSEYQLIYVLFNGQPLKIGMNYYPTRTALKLQRINFFIHNAFDIRADPVFGQIAAEKGSGEATLSAASPPKEGEAPNASQVEKIGIVTEFKDDPSKRKPWTEWVIEYVYKDAFILPSNSRKDVTIQDFEFKEGPYSESEMIKMERQQRKDPGKDKVHIETKRTTFETMDAHVKNIEEISKKIQGLEQSYQLVINKIGIKPIADAIMNCVMKELPTVEDVMIAIGLGDVFKDTKSAIQFIGDILSSAGVQCTTKVLSEALVLEYEEAPEQQIPGIANYDGTTATIPGEVAAQDASNPSAAEADEQPTTGEPETQTSGVEAFKQIVAIRTSMIPKIFKGVFKDKISEYGIDFDFQNDPEVVKKAQQGLNAWINSYGGDYKPSPLAIDGIFGPETEEQAKKFNEIATSDTIDIGEAGAGGISIDGYPLEGLTKTALDNVYGVHLNGAGASEADSAAPPEENVADTSDPESILLKEGSRDNKAGLKDQVTKWQMFLVSKNTFFITPGDEVAAANAPASFAGLKQEGKGYFLYDDPENPAGAFNPVAWAKGTAQQYWPAEPPSNWYKTDFPIDGIFGPKTALATKNWLQGAASSANSDASVWYLGADTSEQQVPEGVVSNKQFKFALSVIDSVANSADPAKLDDLLDPSQADRLRFIGPRAPAGFYCRLGEPGPCDRIYSEIIKIGRKIAAGEASSAAGIEKLIAEQDALKIKYTNCMSSAEEEPVIGEGKDHFAGKEGTEAEQATEMANLVVKVEAKCNDLRNDLITNLANAGVEDLTMWPGDDYIDKIADQNLAIKLRESLRKYTECYNEEITEIRKKFLENNLFAPDSHLSTITEIYPFPRTVEEAWEQFRATGRFPTNVALNPEFDGERLVKIMTEDPDCGLAMEQFIDLLLEYVPPPTRQVLKQLIKGALDGSFAAMFKQAGVPQLPNIEEVDVSTFRALVRRTGDPDGLLKFMMEQMLEQMLEEIVTGTVKIFAQYINEICDDAESKGRNEGFGDLTASDIFNGRPNTRVELPDLGDLQDRLNKIQDELNDWNLPLDATPGGSDAPGEAISFWQIVDEMSLLFTPTQLCSLFNGEGSFVLMVTAREFLEERYEMISSMLPSEEDLREFLMVLGKYADPKICIDVRDGRFANPEPTFGEKYCPPDLIEVRKLDDCLKAGLTEEQCQEMLQRERDDKIATVQNIANLDFTLPDVCADIADMKEKLPGLQSALKKMLQDIADSVTMVFNGDTGYFVPALLEDNKLFDLDQAIESMPNILSTLQQADTSGGAGNGTDGIASINTFALQCLKATIPIGATVSEGEEGEEISPNQLDNLDAKQQTELAEKISEETGPSDSEKLGKDVFGKDININAGDDPDPEIVKKSLFDAFNSVGGGSQGTIIRDLANNDVFVAKSLRKSLRSRFEVKTNLQESSVTLEVPRKRDNKVVYKTLGIDALIDSFYVDITEKGERFVFENSRYISERVQVYAKTNDMLATENDPGSFDGEFPPQLVIFDKLLTEALNPSQFVDPPESLFDDDKEGINNLYQEIRKNLIYKMRKDISISKFFKKADLETVDLTPSSRDAKDECGIPIRIYNNDVKVASLLNPDKFIQEALDSYAEAAAKECETGPSDPPPLQQAVAEMALKMYIRTFVVNSSLNTLFMMAKFKVEDYFDDKIFLGYLMKFIKDDMIERRIYTDGKDIAKSIMFKRTERGEEILPKLTTGYDCIKFLTREQFKDVSDQFRMILASSVKSDELYDYSEDKFLSLAILNQPKHVFPYNKAVERPGFNDKKPSFLPVPTSFPEPGRKGLRDVTIIDVKNTLGYDSEAEAKEFYRGTTNLDVSLMSVLEKDGGYFILEPYLRVKDKVFDSMDDVLLSALGSAADLTNTELDKILENYDKDIGEDLDRPINLLIAPFLNTKYVAHVETTILNEPAYIYENIEIDQLYNWNTGLVNYVNMREYSSFLESLYTTYQNTKTAIQAFGSQADVNIEEYEQSFEDYESDYATATRDLTQPDAEAMLRDDWLVFLSNNPDKKITYNHFSQAYTKLGLTAFEITAKWEELRNKILHVFVHFFSQVPGAHTPSKLNQYYENSLTDGFVIQNHPEMILGAGLTVPAPIAGQGYGKNYAVGTDFEMADYIPFSPYDTQLDNFLVYEMNIDWRKLWEMLYNLIYKYKVYTYPRGFKPKLKLSFPGNWMAVCSFHAQLLNGEVQPVTGPNNEPYMPSEIQTFSTFPNEDNWRLFSTPGNVTLGGGYHFEFIHDVKDASNYELGVGFPADFNPEEWQAFASYAAMPQTYKDTIATYNQAGSKENMLTYGTATAVQNIWDITKILREFKYLYLLNDVPQSTTSYAEQIQSVKQAQLAVPSKMASIIETKLENLIGVDGYLEKINWGLRLSYVSESERLPESIRELTDTWYQNSTIEYIDPGSSLPGETALNVTEGLRNLDGAPQHKSEYHHREYTLIPMIEKEIPITVKFQTEENGEQALSDFSIKDLFETQALTPSPSSEYPSIIEEFYFKYVHQDLINQIKNSEEYSSLFDYALPLRRYVTLNSINVMMTMTKIGPGPLMYTSTRDILQSLITSALNGSGPESFEFDDPQLAALGGTAGMFSDAMNSKNFEPKKMNLGLMILKLFLETPFKILKGVTEAFDPNISIIDKIMKVLKVIVETLPTKADPCIVEPVFLGYITDELAAQGNPEGTLSSEKLHELREKAQTDMDRKLRKIKNTLKKILDNMPVPLISIAMLPSMLPYGCGFPPPPIGPGIGPPLTPFGVAYLILGLYRDIDFGKINDLSERGADDELPDDIEILCREKLEAYQRLVAQGPLDFEAADDDD